MYYSKNTSSQVSVPLNYGGNAFRVIDESTREPRIEANASDSSKPPHSPHSPHQPHSSHSPHASYSPQNNTHINPDCDKPSLCEEENPNCNENDETQNESISSILSGISMEDILLLGLILVVHQNDHNDPTLLLLLILLLSK